MVIVHAAAACFDLHVPESRSLKAKRAAIRPIVDGLRHRFHVSVAEVDHHDQWQRAPIGVAVVAESDGHAARGARHRSSASWRRRPDVELLDVETAWLEPEAPLEPDASRPKPIMRDRHSTRRYPRTARVNEVMLEVLADELERMSDPRLELVTLTGVDVAADLRHATVYYSALGSGERRRRGRRCAAAAPASAGGSRPPDATEVPASPRVSFRSGDRARASASRRSSATSTTTRREAQEAGRENVTMSDDGSLEAGARRRPRSRTPARSRSRATSTPTATRSARCSGCTTCCAPPASPVVASFPEPFVVAPHYRELPGLELLTPPERVPARARRDGHLRLRLARPASATSSRPAKAARRADRHRPPRLERALRHDQRDRPRRGRERRARARLIDELGLPLDPRRRGLPLRRARVRHRPLPVRVDDAGGLRARPASSPRSTSRSRALSRTLFEEHRFAYLQLLADALGSAELVREKHVRLDDGDPGRSSRVTT